MINYEGIAGKVEVNSILEMFSRSEELHCVKYSNNIGDGEKLSRQF